MNLHEFIPTKDLWELLRESNKKTVMYGMGNGADKILAVCEKYGIEVCDFFASDGFVRGHSFHGKKVLSYSEITKKYGAENINVLLSFASCLPDVIENFKKINSECALFAPDVPVCGDTLFTLDFARRHKSELEQVYTLLSDEQSKIIFKNVIFYKITGKIDYLFNAVSDKDEVFSELICANTIRRYADLGAY
ncbi:MAG: FkbM family methyltransferase, partial [Clostridia bacterium]|nr:FkbM family methyltransferase [Clostridia bacterium]